MKGSDYIRWAKSREKFRYNVGRSSIRPCPYELLDPRPEDFQIHGDNTHGWPPLLHALADRYGVEPERVTLAIGASMANHLACAALLGAGDHVLVESPGYEPLRSLPGLFGARVEPLERDPEGWGLDPDTVRRRLRPQTRLVILSDYHNPSGAALAPAALEQLAALAEEHDFHVLVDEVYREFTYVPGEAVAATRSPRFVSTCSLTKAYGLDGLRAGWILCARDLAERIRTLNDLYGIIMPHPTERLALRALQRIDVLRADVDALLAVNRRRIERFLAARDDLDWVPPAAGPVGLVRVRGGRVDDLLRLLEERYDTTLPPGHFFDVPDHFRVAFGMLTGDLDEGLRRLGAALDELRQPAARHRSTS